MKIYKELEAIKEEEYAAFQARLIPSIDPSTIMGVRVPKLRALAIYKRPGVSGFFS